MIEEYSLKLLCDKYGVSKENIVNETRTLLTDKTKYERMSGSKNPYGDGTASKQIEKIVREFFK